MIQADKNVLTKKLELLLEYSANSKNIPVTVGDKAYHQYSEFLARDMGLLDDGKPDRLN